MKGMKPVKVYSCADRVQADMLTEALSQEGIPAYTESKGSGENKLKRIFFRKLFSSSEKYPFL